MDVEMLALMGKTISLMESLSFLWVVQTGFELNIWEELEQEQDLESLIKLHPEWDRILIDHWLEQAYCLDLLKKKEKAMTFQSSKLGKAVQKYRSFGLEAMYKEFVIYWSKSFAGLPELIKGESKKSPLGKEMEEELISRASLASEPFVWPFLESKCKREKWRSVLDVGCGEGQYLYKILDKFPEMYGVGIEINPIVAERAQKNAEIYKERLRILCGDALNLDEDIGGFDICLLNNNIYYFGEEERYNLLVNLRRFINPGGKLGILTAVRDTGYQSRTFRTHIPQNLMSFFLASHEGFLGLPKEKEIVQLLLKAGYKNIEVESLPLRTSLYFFGEKD